MKEYGRIGFVFQASLEEPSQTVIMHHTDPSRTQALSLQLVEKIFQLYEQNEKLVNLRYGEPGFYSRPNQRMFYELFPLFIDIHFLPI